MTYKNLHMSLKPDRSGAETIWTCQYCWHGGTYDEMSGGGCTHEYPKCEHCDGSPNSNECAPDCAGIAAILAIADVYVAGDREPIS